MADKDKYKLIMPTDGMKKATPPILGNVVKTQNEGIYAVLERAIVGKQYVVICPACGKPVLTKAVEPDKAFRVMHKTCNVPIIIKGEKLTGRVIQVGSKTNAKLSWWSKTGPKKFILLVGKNYIGSKDNENPSNLSLEYKYAIAKSICIDVNRTVRGYTFHLTVERATNPVLINGKEQPEGSSFDLNYGDIIKLGNTTLTFKPVKK